MDRKKIVVLGTGGTIAGRSAQAGDNVGYVAGQVTVHDLLAGLPLPAGVSELAAEQVSQLDSKDMNWAVWWALAARCHALSEHPDVQAVVVTHGTDTVEETAWFLAQVLSTRKPVVLTCAMRPATALAPDGPQNLLDALALAADAHTHGVWVVAAGEVHAPRHVRKCHPYRVHAFTSDEYGPAGWMEEGRVRWAHVPSAGAVPSSHAQALLARVCRQATPPAQPWVELVASTACASARGVQCLVAAGVQGLVVAATGNGSVHADMEAALVSAAAQGVAVVRASRCTQGQIIAKSGDHLPVGDGLSAVKERVRLMIALATVSA